MLPAIFVCYCSNNKLYDVLSFNKYHNKMIKASHNYHFSLWLFQNFSIPLISFLNLRTKNNAANLSQNLKSTTLCGQLSQSSIIMLRWDTWPIRPKIPHKKGFVVTMPIWKKLLYSWFWSRVYLSSVYNHSVVWW